MVLLQHRDLQELMEKRGDPCVSIFLPANPDGATELPGIQAEANAVRFRKLLGEAEQALRSRGLAERSLEELLEPARELLHDTRFWSHLEKGLAVFLSAGHLAHWPTTAVVRPTVYVGDRFHVTPLLAERDRWRRFYILALDLKAVRLLEAGPEGLRQLDLGACPTSLLEELETLMVNRDFQHHARKPAGGTLYHDRDWKSEIQDLLRSVSRAVEERLDGAAEPLVPAGVEYVVALYRQVNHYPHLTREAVLGSPRDDRELLEKGRRAARPHLEREQDLALRRYLDLKGTGLASDRPEDIRAASVDGRVKALFVASGHPVAPQDPIDTAMVQTLGHGGQVYLLERTTLPDGAVVAALLRY